jgi:hypothetical protein
LNIPFWALPGSGQNCARNSQTVVAAGGRLSPVSSAVTEELTEAIVYPNPALNEVTITLPPSYNEGEKMVSLQNAGGGTVLSGKFEGTNHKINIGTLPQGLYVLKVNIGRKVSVRKVIKK